MKSKTLIVSGAIGGFFVGENVSDMLLGDVLTAQHIILTAASIALGAFIGHILRH